MGVNVNGVDFRKDFILCAWVMSVIILGFKKHAHFKNKVADIIFENLNV